MHNTSWRSTLALAAVPFVFLTLLLAAPALRLAWEAWRYAQDAPSAAAGEGWLAVLWQPWVDGYLRARLLWSGAQAALSAALCACVGLPVAWVLARWEFVGRVWVLRLVMLPFVVPTLVAALGVLALWGPQGWLARWGGADWQGTPWLLLYGNVFFNLCVVVQAGVQGLECVSAARMGAARTLGATPWRAFWRVELPTVLPWLASALCLVYLYCWSGFGLALVLGGTDYATVEVEIYTLVAHELQLGSAVVLAGWALVLSSAVVWLYARLQRRSAVPTRLDRIARRRPQTAAQWLGVGAALGVLLLVCALPLLALVVDVLAHLPQSWPVLLQEDTLAALGNTLRLSVGAVLLASLLGVLHALAAQRWAWLRLLAYGPLLVSAVVLAFGVLLLYPDAADSVYLLLAAYALLAYPLVLQPLLSALDAMPPTLLQVARSLGASPWRAWWRVTLPCVAPALRRGMAFAGASAVGEFAVTLFLSRPEWTTLSTLVYQYLGHPGAANRDAALLLATLLMLLALLFFAVLDRAPAPLHA